MGVGAFKDWSEIERYLTVESVTEPNPEAHARYQALFEVYLDLYPTLRPTFGRLAELTRRAREAGGPRQVCRWECRHGAVPLQRRGHALRSALGAGRVLTDGLGRCPHQQPGDAEQYHEPDGLFGTLPFQHFAAQDGQPDDRRPEPGDCLDLR